MTTKNVGFLTLLSLLLSVVAMPSTTEAVSLDRQLEIGMSGNDVSDLQTFLAQDKSIYPQGLVTGYFGPLTQSAVSNFQARNGIATVGRVGPITLVALNTQMNTANKIGFDRNSPIVDQLNVSTSNTNAVLTWNTNEGTSAIVYYSTSPLMMKEGDNNSDVNISGTSFLVHTDLQTTHSTTLTGLGVGTLYYYIVYVKDGSGNVSVTSQGTFRTTN